VLLWLLHRVRLVRLRRTDGRADGRTDGTDGRTDGASTYSHRR